MIKLEIQEIYDKNITQLDLSKRQLKVLPPKIGTFKKLKLLNLNNNRLSTLPHEISKLAKTLDYLSIRDNLLKLIPPEIYAFLNLSYLNLSSNHIKYILSITTFINLSYLNLANTELKFLPLLPKNIKDLYINRTQILFIVINKNINMCMFPSNNNLSDNKLNLFNYYDLIFNDDI